MEDPMEILENMPLGEIDAAIVHRAKPIRNAHTPEQMAKGIKLFFLGIPDEDNPGKVRRLRYTEIARMFTEEERVKPYHVRRWVLKFREQKRKADEAAKAEMKSG